MIIHLYKQRSFAFTNLIQTFWVSNWSKSPGKRFELKTSNEDRLLEKGFTRKEINNSKYGYYFSRILNGTEVIYATQNGMKLFIQKEYGKEIFRLPDEAYLIRSSLGKDKWIHSKNQLKIIEKKSQTFNGSIDTKLWSGPGLKREYELMLGSRFEIKYAFCLNYYLGNLVFSDTQKYQLLRKILEEYQIPIFLGDSEDYFRELDEWIGI
jgi:hypothetical protein